MVKETQTFFDWHIYESYVLSYFGNIPDHTLDSEAGHFIIANGKKQNDTSKIFSQILEPTSDSGICFSFYYRYNGGNF